MDEKIAQFSGVTGADAGRAKFFVESANGDLEAAIAAYFENDGGQDAAASSTATASASAAPAAPGPSAAAPSASSTAASASDGPRTLSGAPAEPLPAGWGSSASTSSSSPATNSGSRKAGAGFSASGGSRGGGIATLRDYRDEEPSNRRGGGDDDDDDDRDPENLYAGGERSGLSVQNPDSGRGRGGAQPDAVRQILEQARRAAEQLGRGGGGGDDDEDDDEDEPRGSSINRRAGAGAGAGASNFSGAGQTIGDSGPSEPEQPQQASQSDDPSSSEAVPSEVERTLTFWSDGFSIGDGPLRAYEDEESKRILEQIKSGTAPLSLFNVRLGQRVSISVAHRTNEKYTPPPPPPMQPFGGSGNRLGSPSVQPSTSTSTNTATPPASTSSPLNVDPSKPTTTIQIRTGDGSRLIGQFNQDHLVSDIRNYIRQQQQQSSERSFTLHTSFPPKLISDENQSIKDAGLLNAVVIQKWA
ncbi:unnamed protein product [Sympodiomycopsis kandeliae]